MTFQGPLLNRQSVPALVNAILVLTLTLGHTSVVRAEAAWQAWVGTLKNDVYVSSHPYASAAEACVIGFEDLKRLTGMYDQCSKYTDRCYNGTIENNCNGVANTGGIYWNCESAALILSDGGPYGGSQNLFACVPHEYYVSAQTAAPGPPPSSPLKRAESCPAGNPAVPSPTVGNPIYPASGEKFQAETDYQAASPYPLEFTRSYSSLRSGLGALGAGWRHNFERRLRIEVTPAAPVHNPSSSAFSSRYTDPRQACEAGWDEVKGVLAGVDGSQTRAAYEGERCRIYLGGSLWGVAPIHRAVGVSVDNATVETVYVERPNGEQLRFYKTPTDTWRSEGDVGLTLQTFAGGYILRNEKDQLEYYDGSGRLLHIENKLTGLTYGSGGRVATLIYGADGRLSSVADDSGHSLTFGYRAGISQIASITDEAGRVWSYDYDHAANLTTVTYPDQQTRRFIYDDARFPSALTGIVDEKGQRFATWQYDAQGRAILSEHAGGAERVSLMYNADGSTTVTNALGLQTTYHFADVAGTRKLTQVQGHPTALCEATTRALTYDAEGRVETMTDANGVITELDSDNRGLELKRIEAAGTGNERVTLSEWSSIYRLPTCRVEPNKTTLFTLDINGRTVISKTEIDTSDPVLFPNDASKACQVARYTRAPSRTWTTAENIFEKPRFVDGPRTDVSDITNYTYDSQGKLTAITNALGHITQIPEHDANGRPLAVIDPNGLRSELTYDARGRVRTRTVKLASADLVTTFGYDPTGQLTSINLPTGDVLGYEYDAAHRLKAVTNNFGERIDYTLDAAGNLLREEVRGSGGTLARVQSQAFNELSQLIQSIGAQNQLTEYDYDLNGNRVSTTDPLVHTTLQAFDALNRVIRITDAKQGVTQLGYNPQDEITRVTDPRGVSTTYEYDGLGNLLKETSADRGVTTYTYDAAGNVLTKTDARGKTSTYTYDALNRLATATHADGSTETYSYDTGTYAIGRLTQVTDSTGSVAYSYDQLGRLTSKVQKVGTKTFTTAYSYDAQGRLATLTYPSGMMVTYGYSAGRVTSLTVNGTPLLTAIAYEPFGPVSGWTFGNGTAFDRTFDLDGRLKSQTFGAGTRSYTFDAASRITKFTDPSHNLTFTYDVLDRLIKSTGTYGRTYDYDANGNRVLDKKGTTQTDYVTDTSSNRLLSTTSAAVTKARVYDAAGNTLNDGTYSYVYDARGRLVESRNASDALIGSYKVNALGQRVYKKRGTAITHFVYDEGGHLIGEYNGAGTLVQETLYLGDIPVGVWKAGVLYFIHADHLNTPRAILDQANRVIWLWKAEPFGSQSATQNPDGDTLTFAYNLRFPGQYFDQETGLFYNYFRDYDPRTGRYVTSDPIGLSGGLNTYAYVANNPLKFVDLLGLEKLILMNTNSMVTSEAVMAATARSYPDQKGVMMVFGHASSELIADDRQGGLLFNNRTYLTPEDLATILKNDPSWSDNMPVVLMACETAKGENSFAQRLSEILKTRVTAFPEKISWVSHAPRPNNPIVFEPRN